MSNSREAHNPHTPPGNADGYQNKGLAKKPIRKRLKVKALKIDGLEGATHNMMKRKGGQNLIGAGCPVGGLAAGRCFLALRPKLTDVGARAATATGTKS